MDFTILRNGNRLSIYGAAWLSGVPPSVELLEVPTADSLVLEVLGALTAVSPDILCTAKAAVGVASKAAKPSRPTLILRWIKGRVTFECKKETLDRKDFFPALLCTI
jgi:hypothetical protein